jgi:hypothetical protein
MGTSPELAQPVWLDGPSLRPPEPDVEETAWLDDTEVTWEVGPPREFVIAPRRHEALLKPGAAESSGRWNLASGRVRLSLAAGLAAAGAILAATVGASPESNQGPVRAAAPGARAAADRWPALTPLAYCESGGDPTAVSPDGRYRGKYQFDLPTWAHVGGRGDPAAAPEREQDRRALLLFRQRGTSPWPVCGPVTLPP